MCIVTLIRPRYGIDAIFASTRPSLLLCRTDGTAQNGRLARELRDYAPLSWNNADARSRAVVEAHTNIRNILHRIDEITAEARTLGRPLAKVEAIRAEVTAIQQEMLAQL